MCKHRLILPWCFRCRFAPPPKYLSRVLQVPLKSAKYLLSPFPPIEAAPRQPRWQCFPAAACTAIIALDRKHTPSERHGTLGIVLSVWNVVCIRVCMAWNLEQEGHLNIAPFSKQGFTANFEPKGKYSAYMSNVFVQFKREFSTGNLVCENWINSSKYLFI